MSSLGPEFSLYSDDCSGASIPTGGTCDITLRFQPTTSNAFSGELRWPIVGPVLAHATSTVTADAGVAIASVSATGNGSISPSLRTVRNQETGQFTLTPQPHHHIQSATGCNGSLDGNVYTTGPVDRPCTVSVAFAPNLYTVDATAIGNGTVSPASQVLMANQTASLTLTPAANHHVANVSGCTGTLNNNTFTTDPITASCSVQATFALNSYSVTTASQGNGVISPSTASVAHGGTPTFTLTPAPNHHLVNVSGCNGSLNGSQYTTGPITSACAVNASFELDHYQITASSTGNGTISPTTLSVGHGQSATFTLTPAGGYGIAGVSGCPGTLNGNEYTIDSVTQACAITADFSAAQPSFTTDLSQPLDIDATGLLTALSQDTYPQATDALGNPLEVTLVNDQAHFLPGRHELQWRAVDEAGVAVTATQVLQVWPIVAMGPNVWMGQQRGDVASFKVVLNGPAPAYPYDVAYRVDGAGVEHDLRSGTVRFENGQTEQDVFVAITAEPAPNTPARATTVTLENTRNIGTRDALTVYMNQHNLPPVAQVRALRADQDGSSFDRHGGAITLMAEVNDPNTQDTHSYLWSIPSQAAVTDHGASLVLEPATMEPGIHRFQVQITDDGAPAMSITAALDLVITETPVALPSGAAGWLPSALPAHADYALPMSNVLPSATSEFQQHLLEAAPGLQLRLGAMAIQEAAHQAQLTNAALPADTVANIGGYFDFQLSGLNSPGNLATVVIPQRSPVPERAVYRKFDIDKQMWHSFVQNSLNQIASAPGAPGICPPPHSTEYRPGLTQGDWCVRLTLEDGGPNDSDGEPNGVIADPGGVGQADVVSIAPPVTRSGRGSLGWMTLGMLATLLCARRAAMSRSR